MVTLTFRKSRACRWCVVTLLYGLTVLADAAPVVRPTVVTAMTAAATEPSVLWSFMLIPLFSREPGIISARWLGPREPHGVSPFIRAWTWPSCCRRAGSWGQDATLATASS